MMGRWEKRASFSVSENFLGFLFGQGCDTFTIPPSVAMKFFMVESTLGECPIFCRHVPVKATLTCH